MNYITKKHLSRRMVMRGGGVAMALPFLTAMVPAATALAKTAAAGKPRLGFVYFPHGAVMNMWTPKTVGANFDLPPILAPLAKHQAQMTVVSNLANANAVSQAVHAITLRHLAQLREAAREPQPLWRDHRRSAGRPAYRRGDHLPFSGGLH